MVAPRYCNSVDGGSANAELSRETVRSSARRLIVEFMAFTTVLMVISGGFAAYDTTQNSPNEMNEKLRKINAIASSLDTSVLVKTATSAQLTGKIALKEVLAEAMKSICTDVGKIGDVTGDNTLGDKCKANSRLHGPPG
jgi:hypothetical protein